MINFGKRLVKIRGVVINNGGVSHLFWQCLSRGNHMQIIQFFKYHISWYYGNELYPPICGGWKICWCYWGKYIAPASSCDSCDTIILLFYLFIYRMGKLNLHIVCKINLYTPLPDWLHMYLLCDDKYTKLNIFFRVFTSLLSFFSDSCFMEFQRYLRKLI